jgi:hypothetical protein
MGWADGKGIATLDDNFIAIVVDCFHAFTDKGRNDV